MGISSRLSSDGTEVVIDIAGRFDFSLQREFREAFKGYEGGLRYRVDLSKTEYMDSSALGMLLLLRKHAGDVADRVRLSGANGTVAKILKVANFDKMFNIS